MIMAKTLEEVVSDLEEIGPQIQKLMEFMTGMKGKLSLIHI